MNMGEAQQVLLLLHNNYQFSLRPSMLYGTRSAGMCHQEIKYRYYSGNRRSSAYYHCWLFSYVPRDKRVRTLYSGQPAQLNRRFRETATAVVVFGCTWICLTLPLNKLGSTALPFSSSSVAKGRNVLGRGMTPPAPSTLAPARAGSLHAPVTGSHTAPAGLESSASAAIARCADRFSAQSVDNGARRGQRIIQGDRKRGRAGSTAQQSWKHSTKPEHRAALAAVVVESRERWGHQSLVGPRLGFASGWKTPAEERGCYLCGIITVDSGIKCRFTSCSVVRNFS